MSVEPIAWGFRYGLSGSVHCKPITLTNGMLNFQQRFATAEEAFGTDAEKHYSYDEGGMASSEARLFEILEGWLVVGLEPEELPNRIQTSWGCDRYQEKEANRSQA